MTRVTHWVVLGLVGLLWAGGCGGNAQPFVTAERLDRGLVLVLTGIEGRSPFNRAVCEGLADGGVDGAIEVADWTRGIPGLYLWNLLSEARNRDKADEIAQRVLRYRMLYPQRPVVLVGQSGGGAMAVWVAEALPTGVKVDGIVLLAAALSPDYALDAALANSRRGIVNFYSYRDVVFLAAGTTLTGTMDGRHTSSAGRVGFNVPSEPARARRYATLFQIPWQAEMGRTGNPGMHLTSGTGLFVMRYVAPLVLTDGWSKDMMKALLAGDMLAPLEPATAPGTGAAPASAPSAGGPAGRAGPAGAPEPGAEE